MAYVIRVDVGTSSTKTALWREAIALIGQDRVDFLQGPAFERLNRLTSLCDALARPWTEFYTSAEVGADWYQQYQSF